MLRPVIAFQMFVFRRQQLALTSSSVVLDSTKMKQTTPKNKSLPPKKFWVPGFNGLTAPQPLSAVRTCEKEASRAGVKGLSQMQLPFQTALQWKEALGSGVRACTNRTYPSLKKGFSGSEF